MNVAVTTFVRFSGPFSELEPLLSRITDAVIESGYANVDETDALTCLVTVGESAIGDYENVSDFVRSASANSITVIFPMDKQEVEGA